MSHPSPIDYLQLDMPATTSSPSRSAEWFAGVDGGRLDAPKPQGRNSVYEIVRCALKCKMVEDMCCVAVLDALRLDHPPLPTSHSPEQCSFLSSILQREPRHLFPERRPQSRAAARTQTASPSRSTRKNRPSRADETVRAPSTWLLLILMVAAVPTNPAYHWA
jgi:hypothetical protein